MLKSSKMVLSAGEKHWLPWFGKTGKLAMRWATSRNLNRYHAIEQTFESFAQTRVRILINWAEQQWTYLDGLARELALSWPQPERDALLHCRERAEDFSELCVVSVDGRVLRSTHTSREGSAMPSAQAVAAGLKGRFLHGPYRDPVTRSLPPSSSRFHDAVTLMFYQPITVDGAVVGLVCGRVPNDVLGDLIQREAGHIFHESGDNYLFMVKSAFDPSIRQGTALSRSRFEMPPSPMATI